MTSDDTDLPGWLPASTAGRLAVGYLAGVLLARVAGLVLPLDLGPFAVTLSLVAFPVLFWTGAKLAMRPRAPGTTRTRLALAVAAGVVGDELVFLAIRVDGVEYWSPTSLAGSAAIATLALGVVAGLSLAGDEDRPDVPGRRLAALSSLAVAAGYVGYRVSQVYLRRAGVPNEDRSLILAGHEIHHATTGSLLLVVAALALASRRLGTRAHRAAALGFAVGAGFVADEYPYLFYPVMTDELYFEPLSMVGGFVTTGTIIVFLLFNYRISRQEDMTGEHR